MLPYLIATVIGGGLALRNKKKYAKGGVNDGSDDSVEIYIFKNDKGNYTWRILEDGKIEEEGSEDTKEEAGLTCAEALRYQSMAYYAKGGVIKGRNNQTGESFYVLDGSKKNADDYTEGGKSVVVVTTYGSRTNATKLIFDKKGNLLEYADMGRTLDGTLPVGGLSYGRSVRASSKKESIEGMRDAGLPPAFAKKVFEYMQSDDNFARGGEVASMTERLAEILENDYGYKILKLRTMEDAYLEVNDYRPDNFERVILEIVNDYPEMRDLDFEVFKSNKGVGVEVLNYARGGEVVPSRTVREIGYYTGVSANAVQNFVDENNLDIERLFQYVQKGTYTDRMDLMTAIVGKPGNKIQKQIIKDFTAKGGMSRMEKGRRAAIGADFADKASIKDQERMMKLKLEEFTSDFSVDNSDEINALREKYGLKTS